MGIHSIMDIAGALNDDPRFVAYEVLRADGELVEVRCDTGTALLVAPTLWRDPQRVTAELGRNSRCPPLLVCLGGEGEMDDLQALRQRAVLACLPLPTTAHALEASLTNSMALLAMQARAVERDRVTERYRYEVEELISIAASLSSERDIHRLLALILEKSRYISGADAGSVYILVPHPDRPDDQLLRFAVAQNDSVEVDFESFTLEISSRSIVGAAVVARRVIHIPDLGALARDNPLGLEHNRSFDDRTGYHTRSVLTVPMINHQDAVIGVIQLINKKREPASRLRTVEDFERQVIPFDERSIELGKTLAYQAAIALDNALLYNELREVFEGFVEASVLAIEARDPPTSGHSRRVANLTVGLAEAVDHVTLGPLAELSFSPDNLKELEYAALMHDFGKVGVPEQVLVKAHKLYEWNLEQIRLRFDYVREWLKSESLRRRLELSLQGTGRLREQLEAQEALLQKQHGYLEHCWEIIAGSNRPTVLPAESAALLDEIAQQTYLDPKGVVRPYLTGEELRCLRIRRGSLSEDERAQIESHVVHSYNFLCTIPWGRGFRQVPQIARDHHEKLDGTGYPRRKCGDQIPVQARMMTIADIYDALTAADRPYKPALEPETALAILGDEVRQGKLDAALFSVFVEAHVYRKVLKTT